MDLSVERMNTMAEDILYKRSQVTADQVAVMGKDPAFTGFTQYLFPHIAPDLQPFLSKNRYWLASVEVRFDTFDEWIELGIGAVNKSNALQALLEFLDKVYDDSWAPRPNLGHLNINP